MRQHDIQNADGVLARLPGVGVTLKVGGTVPSDGAVGYSPGCIFIKKNGGAGTVIYINEGTKTSADFNALPSTTALGNTTPNPVGSPTAGVKMASGQTTLDGTNPTPVVTGLTTITSIVCTINTASAPGVGTSVVTANIANTSLGAGNVPIYGWKPTAANDCTLIASTGTEVINWVATGT